MIQVCKKQFRDLLVCFSVLRIHFYITPIAPSLVSDGKIYDAYVLYPKNRESCLYSSDIFALKILPEVLERQCGYNLFIFGRDDLPGEGKLSEDKLHSSFLIGSLKYNPETGSQSDAILNISHCQMSCDFFLFSLMEFSLTTMKSIYLSFPLVIIYLFQAFSMPG